MQGDFFSEALLHKERALQLLDTFDAKAALECLQIARDIDPYLADLSLYTALAEYLLSAGGRPGMSPAEAVALWHGAHAQWQNGHLHASVVKHLRQTLARHLLAAPPAAHGFCAAREKVLHRGVCHLVLQQWSQAHHELLDLVSNPARAGLPVHWGYLADAAHALGRRKEANAGYLRLLLSDPQAADLLTLQHAELRRILEDLRLSTGSEELARSLWPFEAWFRQVLHIPAGQSFLLPEAERLRSLLGGQLKLERRQSLQQFCWCLCLDQAQLHAHLRFDVRAEMQALEPELFARYLAEVGRRAAMPRHRNP